MRRIKTVLKRAVGNAFPATFYGRCAAHAALQRQFREVFSIPRTEEREGVWDKLIADVKPSTPVLYLEFGVWQGYSIKYFAQHFTNPESRFVGCDSFYGLPVEWGDSPAGRFSTEGNIPQTDDARIQFVKGWFQNTFPQVIDIVKAHGAGKTIIVHFDADIYSATLFLLNELHKLFDSYEFVFDEFTGEESLALLNYMEAYGSDVAFHAACFRYDLPVQVSGRLTTNRGQYEPGFVRTKQA
ncbi:class I SAM-dependent methyltransferase [Xanthobacter sp. KR7-225]|uniref:class I SAM-dependent methyltransferase n=1 Tax=Xanthobacter sp. KR7-225 TaxID=3156613 RepID=UPI0032B53501